MTEHLEQDRIEYVGGLYLRPAQRGTCLTGLEDWPDFERWLRDNSRQLGIEVAEESPAQFRIVIERLGSSQDRGPAAVASIIGVTFGEALDALLPFARGALDNSGIEDGWTNVLVPIEAVERARELCGGE